MILSMVLWLTLQQCILAAPTYPSSITAKLTKLLSCAINNPFSIHSDLSFVFQNEIETKGKALLSSRVEGGWILLCRIAKQL